MVATLIFKPTTKTFPFLFHFYYFKLILNRTNKKNINLTKVNIKKKKIKSTIVRLEPMFHNWNTNILITQLARIE